MKLRDESAIGAGGGGWGVGGGPLIFFSILR